MGQGTASFKFINPEGMSDGSHTASSHGHYQMIMVKRTV